MGLFSSSSTSTSTQNPFITPEYKGLGDLLRQRAMDRLQNAADISGYRTAGLTGINQAYGGAAQNVANALTARGLSTSPAASIPIANVQIARGGQMAQFLNSLPLLQRQLQNEDFANAANVLGQFGRGVTGTQQVTSSPSILGGIGQILGTATGIGGALSFLNGAGVFGGNAPQIPPGTVGFPTTPAGIGTGAYGPWPSSAYGITGGI